jgi:hypothetical protein
MVYLSSSFSGNTQIFTAYIITENMNLLPTRYGAGTIILTSKLKAYWEQGTLFNKIIKFSHQLES